ncbi:F-box protein GID2-like [Magnolia sinica]|uniref:F-box protein GID2-like n=1 Tax=Magnolia sinica TaxID=86752 RepID=UPI002659F978|nr:F-box protein GID2-like [Magnolia sinica]
MKRPLDENPSAVEDLKKKKRKEEEEMAEESGFVHLDEDLLFEVLKHVDARSLATAACVSKQWHKTAQDERLWEMICTRHWANTGCGTQQLRSVVLALGGFRRLHSTYLRPLLKPQLPSSSSTSLPFPVISPKTPAHWGKDEVHLSLSLLSIRYYEKMNLNKRGR